MSVEGGVARGLELTPYKISLAEHFISFIQLFNMNINYFQESLIVNNSFFYGKVNCCSHFTL